VTRSLDSGADSGLRSGDTSATDAGVADGAGEVLPLYLREIGRVPLLTAADEVRLAQAMEHGREALERLDGSPGDDAER
jgi:RNA polymerase primary sigma factor